MSTTEIIGNNTGKMLTLTSNDNFNFSIDIDTAKHSTTIKNMLEDLGNEDDSPIPLSNINGYILRKVLIFCDYIQNNSEEYEALKKWTDDRAFTIPLSQWFSDYINVEQAELSNIILAANFLDIQSLLLLGSKQVASFIRTKTPEEIKVLFSTNSTVEQ
jgi:hypothetical protein